MDRVHGFGSWVHDIVDQSWPLMLIQVARILLKRRYRWSNPGPPSTSEWVTSNLVDGGGAQAWRDSAIGGSQVFRSQALRGTVTWGFWGKMMWGSTGFWPDAKRGGEWLQDGSHRWLPSSEHGQRWAAASVLFRLQEAAQRLRCGILLLLGWFNGSNRRRLARIWWQLGFGRFQALRVKIWAMGCAIYRGFWIEL
jgi:hypothetical protein